MSGAATARAKPGRDHRERVTAFKAPLLDRILQNPGADVEDAPRQVVLDLGAASQPLLERLSALGPCRVEIADLVAHDGLAVLNAPDAFEEPGSSPIPALLPAPGTDSLDLILCWDLPNYLSLRALGELCSYFGPRAAPGCRLHMLIAYSKREMPSAPARYLPEDDGRLRQVCADASIAAAPRHSPEALGDAVGGFRYERGVLLANGMQEFVYAWPR